MDHKGPNSNEDVHNELKDQKPFGFVEHTVYNILDKRLTLNAIAVDLVDTSNQRGLLVERGEAVVVEDTVEFLFVLVVCDAVSAPDHFIVAIQDAVNLVVQKTQGPVVVIVFNLVVISVVSLFLDNLKCDFGVIFSRRVQRVGLLHIDKILLLGDQNRQIGMVDLLEEGVGSIVIKVALHFFKRFI